MSPLVPSCLIVVDTSNTLRFVSAGILEEKNEKIVINPGWSKRIFENLGTSNVVGTKSPKYVFRSYDP